MFEGIHILAVLLTGAAPSPTVQEVEGDQAGVAAV